MQACRRRVRRSLLGAALVLLPACRSTPDELTVALALLPAELPAYRAVVADFESATARRVVVVPQQYADIRRALAAEAGAGRGTLDLVELDVYSLAPAAPHVAVLDRGELAPVLDALDPAAVRAGTIDGLRFLPHRVSWQALLYDHDALPRPPATWDELLAVARAHPGKIGFKGALYEGLTCDVLPFVWAAGGRGDVLDDDGALAAFRLFAELAPYLHPGSATFKEPTIVDAMARGELVLHLNWPFTMSLYASQGLAPDPIRSAPLPRGPVGRATVLGGGYLAVPRNAPHREAAIALARHLLGRGVQARFASELGWFSARRDVAVGADGGLLDGFTAMRDVVRSRPERPDYAVLSRAWQQAFRAVVFDHADPAATLHAAARDLAAGEAVVRDRRWLLAVPLVAYLALLLAYPTAYAVKLAFTDTLAGRFPSLASFRLLAGDGLFWRAVAGNLVLPVLSVTLELAGGLALALLLAARLPARRLLRAAVVVPFALPEIVFLTIMRYVFATRGYANAALVAAGAPPVDWLLPGRTWAWLTVVAVDAWHTTPVVFLMLLAALAAIPAEIDEAARLDGAGGVRRLVHVTLPLLAPAILAALLLRGVDALRIFATPLVLTGVEGVPVLSTYAYHQWSDYGNDGAAAAAASLLALLSVVLTVPLLRWRLAHGRAER